MNSIIQKVKQNKVGSFVFEFIRRFSEDDVPKTAAQLAYHLLMSFFPLLIFLISILSFTALDSTDVVRNILGSMPEEAANLVGPVLRDVIGNRSGAILSISLILALWSGSNGINNFIKSMDSAFDMKSDRNFFVQRGLAVLFTILLVIIIIITFSLQVFGGVILGLIQTHLINSNLVNTLWTLAQTLLPLVIMSLSFALFYMFGPDYPKGYRLRFKHAIMGGAFTAVGWTIISYLFSFYVSNFGNYSRTYGSLGGIIILMLWFFISSLIIMLGAEFIITWLHQFHHKRYREIADQVEEDAVPQDPNDRLYGEEEDPYLTRPLTPPIYKYNRRSPKKDHKKLVVGSVLGAGVTALAGVIGSKAIKKRRDK